MQLLKEAIISYMYLISRIKVLKFSNFELSCTSPPRRRYLFCFFLMNFTVNLGRCNSSGLVYIGFSPKRQTLPITWLSDWLAGWLNIDIDKRWPCFCLDFLAKHQATTSHRLAIIILLVSVCSIYLINF